MQVKFEQEVAQEDLSTALEEIGSEIYGSGDEAVVAATETDGAEFAPDVDEPAAPVVPPNGADNSTFEREFQNLLVNCTSAPN